MGAQYSDKQPMPLLQPQSHGGGLAMAAYHDKGQAVFDSGTAVDSDDHSSSGTLTSHASPVTMHEDHSPSCHCNLQLQVPSELDSAGDGDGNGNGDGDGDGDGYGDGYGCGPDISWRTNMTPEGHTPVDHGAPSIVEWKQQKQDLIQGDIPLAMHLRTR